MGESRGASSPNLRSSRPGRKLEREEKPEKVERQVCWNATTLHQQVVVVAELNTAGSALVAMCRCMNRNEESVRFRLRMHQS